MISRYEAFMDGMPLSHIHPDLYIHDISHAPGSIDYSTNNLMNRHGSIIGNIHRNGAEVKITFELHIYSISERQRICQEVARWASGAILEVNDRPGQQLHVRCMQYPYIESAQRWTDPIEMTFQAYEKPFWEEKNISQVTISGNTGSGTLYVPGNAGDALVEAIITPNSTMANIALTVANTTITLTGCGATSANPVTIAYDDRNIQSIKVGTTSILDKRTGADDLLAACGKINNVSYSASANVSVTFKARGLWL